MNRSEEDYLKAIYELESTLHTDELLSNMQVAKHLAHSAQTVNEMIKKLAQKNLLVYTPYMGSRLTDSGKKIAIKIIRFHRIWETFLVEKLGYTWEEVHDEAEGLEHTTTTKLANRLYAFLGEPETCPHGHIIPRQEQLDAIEEGNKLSLMHANEGQEYYLQSVVDDKEILSYLNDLNFGIGQKFLLHKIDLINELIELSLHGKFVILGFKVAKNLFVCAC